MSNNNPEFHGTVALRVNADGWVYTDPIIAEMLRTILEEIRELRQEMKKMTPVS